MVDWGSSASSSVRVSLMLKTGWVSWSVALAGALIVKVSASKSTIRSAFLKSMLADAELPSQSKTSPNLYSKSLPAMILII